MSQQLIYTSAPRGLKPGKRGFCTVATTPGMAANLADRLEALSGYRHVFAPGDARNPVNYSFLTFSLGGRRLYMLSRVSDAGLDYTQRSNKLAHHVVLEQNELPSAGPAELLAHPGFFETAWSGEPRPLAPRTPPQLQSTPGKCALWEQLTGDAGWGGYLAQPAESAPGTPVMIIYRPDVAVLPLLAEAMALLPPERRWQTTFSTYYTKLPPGVDCQWRCLLEGSAEAESAERIRGAIVIRLSELTQSRRRAPEGPLVEAARTGKLPRSAISGAAAVHSMAVQLEDRELEAALRLEDEPKSRRGRPTVSGLAKEDDEYRLQPPVPILPPMNDNARYSQFDPNAGTLLRTKLRLNRHSRLWIWIGSLAIALLVAAGTAGGVFFLNYYGDISRDDSVAQTVEQISTENATEQEPVTSEGSASDEQHKMRTPIDKTGKLATAQNKDNDGESKKSHAPTSSNVSDDPRKENNGNHVPPAATGGQSKSKEVQNDRETKNSGSKSGTTAGDYVSVHAVNLPRREAISKLLHMPIYEDDLSKLKGFAPRLEGLADDSTTTEDIYFSLKPRQAGEILVMLNSKKQISPMKTASIRVTDKGLAFTWNADTLETIHCEYLRNCALYWETAGKKTRIFFRTPKTSTPFVFTGAGYPESALPSTPPAVAIDWVPEIKDGSLNLNVTVYPKEGCEVKRSKSNGVYVLFHNRLVFQYTTVLEGSGRQKDLKLSAGFCGVVLDRTWTNSRPSKVEHWDVYRDSPGDLAAQGNRLGSEMGEINAKIEELAEKINKEKDVTEIDKLQKEKAMLQAQHDSTEADKNALEGFLRKWQEIVKYRVNWDVEMKVGNVAVPIAMSSVDVIKNPL